MLIHVSLRWRHHLLIGEKNNKLNVSNPVPVKCWTWRLTTIALNLKTMKNIQLEIDSKPAVNSDEVLAMLDKLQVFFEKNDSENEVLWSVTSLTKKVEKMRIESKKQKNINDFFKYFFCSYECKSKQKYWERKINHLKAFVFIFYLQSLNSLSFFSTKIEIRLEVVSATFLLVCFISLKKSTCQTKKNVSYFTWKALFILEIIKF